MLVAASQDEKKRLKSDDDSTKTLLANPLLCERSKLDVEWRAGWIAQIQSELCIRRSASMEICLSRGWRIISVHGCFGTNRGRRPHGGAVVAEALTAV
jgi:hypothetical protein